METEPVVKITWKRNPFGCIGDEYKRNLKITQESTKWNEKVVESYEAMKVNIEIIKRMLDE